MAGVEAYSTMSAEIPNYYVVRRASEDDAIRALRALDAFVGTPGGRVRLQDPDRVVVWRDGANLYVSPGAFSLRLPRTRSGPDALAPIVWTRDDAVPDLSGACDDCAVDDSSH